MTSDIMCDECAGHGEEWVCRNLAHRVVRAQRIRLTLAIESRIVKLTGQAHE